MLFAEQVVALVRKACPYFIWDGTVRVDIMQAQNQQLIVNELESFEANICSLFHYNMKFFTTRCCNNSNFVIGFHFLVYLFRFLIIFLAVII